MADDSKIHRVIDLATAAYLRKLEDQVSWHPSAEELIGYQEARLAPARAEVVRAHLVDCRWCAEEMVLLDSYDEEDGPGNELDESAQLTSWRRILARMAMANVPFYSAADSGGSSKSASPSARSAWTLAASALLAVGGMVALGLALGRLSGSNDMGQTGYVVDLLPEAGHVLRSAENVKVETIPSSVDTLILRLHLGDLTERARYSVTVTTAGERVWQQTDLLRQPTGDFVLVIPREAFAAGDYELNLRGGPVNAERTIAVYRFRLRNLP